MAAKKRGLAQADEPTKKMVSDLGNQAQGNEVSDASTEPGVLWEEESYMVIAGEDGSEDESKESKTDNKSERGMGSTNYPQDVAENAREEGGRNSHRSNQDDE